MVKEGTRRQEVGGSRLYPDVYALIFCKINANFNAKLCKIYAKVNSNLCKTSGC